MIKRKIFEISDAIRSLCPESTWILHDDNYSSIEWISNDGDFPSEEEVQNEVLRLQAAYDALAYQRLRASEYPPIEDYIDGIVKGDTDQVDNYIAACLAVKNKYPKPSV